MITRWVSARSGRGLEPGQQQRGVRAGHGCPAAITLGVPGHPPFIKGASMQTDGISGFLDESFRQRSWTRWAKTGLAVG
jgi:hypothetical protein